MSQARLRVVGKNEQRPTLQGRAANASDTGRVRKEPHFFSVFWIKWASISFLNEGLWRRFWAPNGVAGPGRSCEELAVAWVFSPVTAVTPAAHFTRQPPISFDPAQWHRPLELKLWQVFVPPDAGRRSSARSRAVTSSTANNHRRQRRAPPPDHSASRGPSEPTQAPSLPRPFA